MTRDHLDVGPVSLVLNGEVQTRAGIAVPLTPNNCLFATRINLVVYDPDLKEHRVIQGEPSFWRPQVPEADVNYMLGMVEMPSRWKRFRQGLWEAFVQLFRGS